MNAKDTDDLAVTSDLARGGSAHMIWNLRMQGFSVHEISQQVGLPPVEVDELLMKHHTERQACPTEANDFYRHIAVSRVESLLKTYGSGRGRCLSVALRGFLSGYAKISGRVARPPEPRTRQNRWNWCPRGALLAAHSNRIY